MTTANKLVKQRLRECQLLILHCIITISWQRDTVVERRSLTGELSLSQARPVADG